MFLGLTTVGSAKSASNIVEPASKINTIVLHDAQFYEIYATKYPDGFKWKGLGKWDYGTLLHAIYTDNLSAGNITWSADVISEVRIKKRFEGDTVWKTIYSKSDINTSDDFAVDFIDYLEPSNTTVEYKYVPVFNINSQNVDMDSEGTTVESKFDEWFIIGQYELNSQGAMINEVHPMIVDFSSTPTLNRQTTLINTLGSKYAFVNTNGMTQYYSGSTTCTFVELCVNGLGIDADNAWKYRNSIDEFLANGYSKIIKSFEGDIRLVSTYEEVSHQENGDYRNVSTTFQWAEVGDPTSVGDLYDNGFINTDVDRSLDD